MECSDCPIDYVNLTLGVTPFPTGQLIIMQVCSILERTHGFVFTAGKIPQPQTCGCTNINTITACVNRTIIDLNI